MDEKRFKEILKENGLKVTNQRLLVLEAIASRPERHLTAEEIYELVKVDFPEIGLATVYRTVLLLEELHVVSRLDLSDGCSRYEIVHAYEHHRHHHLICNVCNKVFEVKDDLLDDLEMSIESKYKFKILDHSVKFYGLCEECQSKLDKK